VHAERLAPINTAVSSQELDAADALAGFREQFHLPRGAHGRPAVYFAGNSLGLQPKRAAERIAEELEDWQRFGVLGHHDARRPWIDYHEQFRAPLAQLIGAGSEEVVQMNSTTTNLHLMFVSFYRPTAQRYRIIMERGAFATDRYAVASQIEYHGFDVADALIELGPREGETHLRAEDILACIEREGDSVALVFFSGVQYATGQYFDLDAIVRAAHARGCVAGFDLAHAVGNLPLHLHDWNADFAIWCSYKYLNGGPGAVAGCFVHERHARRTDLKRFTGWWGHDKSSRFKMGTQFEPTAGADGWQLSNPPILGLAPLLASYEIFSQAGIGRLRAKSLRLTGFLESLVTSKLERQVTILTPADPAQRGCQLSLRIEGGRSAGRRTFERLGELDVICDWREPDVIRVAPVPLYNSFADVETFVERLGTALRP